MTSVWRAVAGVALAASLLTAACGDADNTYVKESGSGLFLRLPNDWTVFPVKDGKPAGDPRIDADFGAWSVVIDGHRNPRRSHIEEPATDEPVGTVDVVPMLALQSPLPLAHATLRSLFTVDGSDALESDDVRDLEYDEVDLGGHWGSRLVGTVSVDGVEEIRVAQLAFFDDSGERIYVVRIQCSLDCFDDHETEIEAILDSFTLEAR